MAKQQRLDSNTIVSIAATIVSICALFLSVYQTILSRQQQSASVWPKLIFSNAFYSNGDFYRLNIRNVGIGPAIIRRVRIEQAGHPFGSISDYAKYVLKSYTMEDSAFVFDNIDLDVENVIPQGEEKQLIQAKGEKLTRLFLAKREQFSLTVTYASIYGEEWTVQYGPFGRAAGKRL